MAPTSLIDPFDVSDDPFKGSDVFGHALNDFDIWGDDEEDFHPNSRTSTTCPVMNEFPNDDFTVTTDPMSCSDRSSVAAAAAAAAACPSSPKKPQRRPSRGRGDSKARLVVTRTKSNQSQQPSTENSAVSSFQKQMQRYNQCTTKEDNDDSDQSNNNNNKEKNGGGRTRPVRRNSGKDRRRSSVIGKEASLRNLITLLNTSDPNLNEKDNVETETNEVPIISNKVGPVVSKSIHHSRTLRVRSKSSRQLLMSAAVKDDSHRAEAETKVLLLLDNQSKPIPDTTEIPNGAVDDLRNPRSRPQHDSLRPKVSRTNSLNRRMRPSLADELRNASSRHLDSSRPKLSRSTKSASFAVRRGHSSLTTPAGDLGDSNDLVVPVDVVDNGPSPSIAGAETMKREPSRRNNLVRSTSSRRNPPSRNASHKCAVENCNCTKESSQVLQEETNKQGPCRGNLTRSSSARRKSLSSHASSSGKRLERLVTTRPHGSQLLQSPVLGADEML